MMRATNQMFTDDQHKGLEALAQKLQVGKGELVRQAVDEFLAKHLLQDQLEDPNTSHSAPSEPFGETEPMNVSQIYKSGWKPEWLKKITGG